MYDKDFVFFFGIVKYDVIVFWMVLSWLIWGSLVVFLGMYVIIKVVDVEIKVDILCI